MDPHEGEEVVFQHLLVPFSIHSSVLWKKEESTTPHSSRKTSPDHHRIGMFDGFHREIGYHSG
jgi:hypothetical protein